MKQENQSRSDERIRKLKEQYAALQVEMAQQRKEDMKENAERDKDNAERDKEISELKEKFLKEHAERKKETDERLKKIEKMIEENGKQIGGLGNKFGGYAEAMAMPSIRRILEERFDADFLGPIQYKRNKELAALQVDAWGLSRNGTGVAYIVETKSKFRDEHIEQIWQLVERFRCYREEQAVYPMLAAVQISEEQRQRVWDEGIYLIDINDGVFRYAEPPRDFKPNGYHGVHRVQRSVPQLRLAVGGVEKPRRSK